MNEMLLPSGESWKPDCSGFLKKSRSGMSLLRPVVLVTGGMMETCKLNDEGQSLDDRGDTMEVSALQGTPSRKTSRISGALLREWNPRFRADTVAL
jgi:hypothetical protein